MDAKQFFYLFVIACVLYNTYDGYRLKRNIIISLITSSIAVFGGLLAMFLWFAVFYYSLRFGQNISWWIKTPLIPIVSFATVLLTVFIAAPFWAIHDNYIKTGNLSFYKMKDRINNLYDWIKKFFFKKK